MLKKNYGMTIEDFNKILRSQDGKCANSGCSTRGALVVDHDHKTGKIRGLLCHRCNRALGQAEDSPGRLIGLAEYLQAQTMGITLLPEKVDA